MSNLTNTGFRYFFVDSAVFFISTLNNSGTVTPKPVKIDILFLCKICYLLVDMFCSRFDTNLAPIPWTIILISIVQITRIVTVMGEPEDEHNFLLNLRTISFFFHRSSLFTISHSTKVENI